LPLAAHQITGIERSWLDIFKKISAEAGMNPVAGVFTSRTDAEHAVAELRALGIADNKITLLSPEATQQELEKVPTTNAEAPGIGRTLGAVVGGILGVSAGFEFTTAIATVLIPGVGPIIVAGALGAALLGAAGGVTGGILGSEMDSHLTTGIPEDDLYIYEDALHQGRSVVIALADHAQEDAAKRVMSSCGAESVDRAREMWWRGARDVEKEHYSATGADFDKEEPDYRAGFEAAQREWCRNQSYTACRDRLSRVYPERFDKVAFIHGFERGQQYRKDHTARGGLYTAQGLGGRPASSVAPPAPTSASTTPTGAPASNGSDQTPAERTRSAGR
jgi:hypothetical protein